VRPTGRPFMRSCVAVAAAAGHMALMRWGARSCGDHIAQACATPAGAEHHALSLVSFIRATLSRSGRRTSSSGSSPVSLLLLCGALAPLPDVVLFAILFSVGSQAGPTSVL
jgi:hypothetical protein